MYTSVAFVKPDPTVLHQKQNGNYCSYFLPDFPMPLSTAPPAQETRKIKKVSEIK